MSTQLLEIREVSKHFGGNAAVSKVSFSVGERQIVGLIGPNGSGKTTLFNCITGHYHLSSGEVILEGRRITNMAPDRVCRLGMVRTWQRVKPLENISVLDNVMVGAFARVRSAAESRAQAMEQLKVVGLADLAGKPAGALSIGLKKKLELARALATRPKILLLDEICGGLNHTETDGLLEIIRNIRKNGATIIFIEHDMKAVTGICERIVVLNSGEKLAEGLPSEITSNQAVIAAYLGGGYVHA
jgi:branched-chain amino acid transport system ATP-binding protein